MRPDDAVAVEGGAAEAAGRRHGRDEAGELGRRDEVDREEPVGVRHAPDEPARGDREGVGAGSGRDELGRPGRAVDDGDGAVGRDVGKPAAADGGTRAAGGHALTAGEELAARAGDRQGEQLAVEAGIRGGTRDELGRGGARLAARERRGDRQQRHGIRGPRAAQERRAVGHRGDRPRAQLGVGQRREHDDRQRAAPTPNAIPSTSPSPTSPTATLTAASAGSAHDSR